MKPEDHIFEQIEDYLNKGLDASQRAAFEKTLQESQELSQKVRVHELANDMVIENRLLSVNATLLSHHNSQSGISKGMKLGIATVLTASSIGALLYILNSPSEQKPSTLASNEKVVNSPKEMPIITKQAAKTDDNTGEKIEIGKKPTQNNVVSEPITQTGHEKAIIPQTIKHSELKPIPAELKNETIVKDKDAKQSIEPIATKPQLDKCIGIQLHAALGQASPCYGDQNGRLWLSEGKGGTAPYNIQVLDESKRTVAAQNLGTGRYEVILTDANGCIGKQSVIIQHKICDKDYIFNPFSGDNLEIPAYPASGQLKIFDKQGNIYASSSVQTDVPATWNGQSKNGEMNEGFFNFVIEYSDNMIAKGTITIVR
jgi:hypothetical protein